MKEKKKILIRIGSLRHGGAEKVLVTFLKNLPEDKYEIDLLLNLYSGKYLKEVPNWINVLYLNKGEMITTNRPIDFPQKAFRKIYQGILKKYPKLLYKYILKNNKYDIEFAAIHGFRDEILNSPIVASKKIMWIHNDLRKTEFHDYTDTEVRKFFGYDKIMVISEHIENDFKSMARNESDSEKIIRIYNPIDTQEIITKAEIESKNEIPDFNGPTFVSVGTIFPQKGFDRLLKAHKKLLEEGFIHRVVILGDGYDLENIKKLQNELGVTETSILYGFTNNPYPIIKKADFYILSSRYEGFPTVLFEAITLKKNIIATNVSGVSEMLERGKLGLIVDNSQDGIYLGMKQALQNPDHFSNYQKELSEYKMPFNLENSVHSIQNILDEL